MDILKVLENTISALIGMDAAYFALAAIGLNVQFGYTGLLNFGQAAFMACGAYGLGMTSQYFGVGMWWGIVIGLIYVVVLGVLVGIPTLRLRADYLAIVTLPPPRSFVSSCVPFVSRSTSEDPTASIRSVRRSVT